MDAFLRADARARIRDSLIALMASTVFLTTAPHAAPTADEVGDVDSFGRSVKYLGVKSTLPVRLETDCTADPTVPVDESRCITIAPTSAPAQIAINETGLATMKLPAGSARSMLCFTIQPIGTVAFSNQTSTNQTASLSMRAAITVQNDALNNLQTLDPATNLPINGKIEIALMLYGESRTLSAGHYESKAISGAKACIGGLITRRSLVDAYGLTSAQAALFFSRPTTLTLGLTGSARTIDFGYLAYGVRIYGD